MSPDIRVLEIQEVFLARKIWHLLNMHSISQNENESREIKKEIKDTEQKLLECRKALSLLQWDEALARKFRARLKKK